MLISPFFFAQSMWRTSNFWQIAPHLPFMDPAPKLLASFSWLWQSTYSNHFFQNRRISGTFVAWEAFTCRQAIRSFAFIHFVCLTLQASSFQNNNYWVWSKNQYCEQSIEKETFTILATNYCTVPCQFPYRSFFNAGFFFYYTIVLYGPKMRRFVLMCIASTYESSHLLWNGIQSSPYPYLHQFCSSVNWWIICKPVFGASFPTSLVLLRFINRAVRRVEWPYANAIESSKSFFPELQSSILSFRLTVLPRGSILHKHEPLNPKIVGIKIYMVCKSSTSIPSKCLLVVK